MSCNQLKFEDIPNLVYVGGVLSFKKPNIDSFKGNVNSLFDPPQIACNLVQTAYQVCNRFRFYIVRFYIAPRLSSPC